MNPKFLTFCIAASTCSALIGAHAQLPQQVSRIGKPEIVAQFRGPMPTGVTVSARGRMFTNFPRWGDNVQFTVGEVVNGKAKAFPNAQWNRRDIPASQRFVSVQSVVVDPMDR